MLLDDIVSNSGLTWVQATEPALAERFQGGSWLDTTAPAAQLLKTWDGSNWIVQDYVTGAYPGVPPIITSSSTATGMNGNSFSYQITATNSPTAYNASGLPSGLSINTATGYISGTLTSGGIYNVVLYAANSGGTGIGPLTLTVSLAWSTAFSQSLSQVNIGGGAYAWRFAFTPTVSGTSCRVTLRGGPSNLYPFSHIAIVPRSSGSTGTTVPTSFLFSGGQTANVLAGTSLVSDELIFTVTSGQQYLLIIDPAFSYTGTPDYRANPAYCTNSYFILNGLSYNTQSFAQQGDNGAFSAFFEKLEVR